MPDFVLTAGGKWRMTLDTQKLVRRKLSDAVLDRLLQAIESGEYPPGTQFPSERDLMAAFGVGRRAVREALQILGTRGLIAISHGERAADMAFYTAIAAVTQNPVFEAVSRAMLQWLSRFHASLLHRKGRDVTLAEHRKILDAIAARDPKRATEAMRSHLRRASPLYASPPRVLERAL